MVPSVRISEDQDQRIRDIVMRLRQGKLVQAESILNELDRMVRYASAVPSADGFSNLCHILRLAWTGRHEPWESIVMMEESSRYNPVTRKVED